ncbi:zinc finger protein 454-like isoform X2 [Dermacentor albipictus]|uniref:zinc finger protein 454-like isoform X2 n=1 Tax=Dermacentor albipictus TaxID=60249 RepID=UPI0031FBFED6
MTEQGNGGHTPPAFAFLDEATPYTSREGGEGASGTCYDLPAYIEEYIDDALKARNRQTDATDVNDDTDNGSTNYAPVVSTASADHAWPGTSHAGIEKLSPTTKDSASCSDEAWRCLQNAQHRPIADQTYSLEGFSYSRSTSHLNPGSSSSIDHAQPSTSRAGMVEASAILEYGASIPDDAWKYQWNTQPTRTTDGTYNVDGVTENWSTSYQPLESIRNIIKAMPSTSRAGMEEASANFEDGATNATGTGGTEQRECCGVSGNVSSRRDSTHRQSSDHADGTAPMFTAHHRLSVKKSNNKCETCGKLFSRASYLTVHYRTHTSERPYKCEICHKSFAHCRSFHRHQHIHTGVKPHICHICTKPFRSKDDLKNHLKSHSTDRPYTCDICNASFKCNTTSRKHRKKFHEGKMPYE